MDSSNTVLNSTSTQTTDLQSDGPCASSLPQRDFRSQLPLPQASPHPTAVASVSSSAVTSSSEPPSAQNSSVPIAASSPLPQDIYAAENHRTASTTGPTSRDTAESREGENLKQPLSPQSSGSLRTAEETVDFVTSLQSRRGLNPFQIEMLSNTSHVGSNARPIGFVSSEQLQEILQELSVDAVETTLRSPSQTSKAATQLKFPEASTLSPLSLRTPLSPQPLALFRYPSISPYAMRKRRPPFYSSRRGLACFYTGSAAAGCGRMRDNCERQYAGKDPPGVAVGGTLIQAHNDDHELEEEAHAGGNEMIRKCQRCVLRSRRCSVMLCAKHNCTAPTDLEAGGEKVLHQRHIRDSSGSWDSDSSSSTDYCYYHRPYCDSCLQRGSLLSSDSSSDSSDSEYEGYTSLYRSSHPVVFKEDIKPTFV